MNYPLSPLAQVIAGGYNWSLIPDLAPRLLDTRGLRLQEWIDSGQARVVKQGPHRVVYRVELPGLSFYLKHNRVADRRAWFRELVRPSKARVEYELALAVSARGVPTIYPLAFGEKRTLLGNGESFLITRSLDDCQTLNVFLVSALPAIAEPRRTRIRQRLAVELGRLVARVHDAGVLHNDFHAGNILVRLDEDDRPHLFLIDLNTVRLGPALDQKATDANLVMLNSWFLFRVNRADRLRFWKAYYEARQLGAWPRGRRDPQAERGHLKRAARLDVETWEFNYAFWRRRDGRCVKTNRYYRRVRSRVARGHAVTELDPDALKRLLADPDEPFRRPGATLLKDSASSTLAEFEVLVDGKPRAVIYKRFRVTTWTDPFTALVRPTPAMRSWVRGQGFRERGLPTARTLAVFHRRRRGLCYEGYLLTEKIPDALEAHRYLDDLQRLPDDERRRALRARIDDVARTVRALHQRRLSHRDLKAANVLVRRWGAPPPPPPDTAVLHNLLYVPEGHVWLIDLVGVELFQRLPRSRRAQNLARLNASFLNRPALTRTDRLRFLLTYLNARQNGRGDWKKWWRQVELATREKIARNARNARPLE